MIKSSPVFRSRRRRTSLALFGSPLQRTALEPRADRVWLAREGAGEALVGAAQDGNATSETDIQDIVARLRREARADRRLRLADEAECDRLIDEAVRALWSTSRVKSFVPLFAMQRVRERLGLADDLDDIRA